MIFNLFKKKETPKETLENPKETPKETPKPVETPKPAAPSRVWVVKRAKVECDPDFLKSILDDINIHENYDYELKKKELIEDFEGEKVWEYSPTPFPFELLDDGSVVIEDILKKKITIGKVGEKNLKAIRKSIEEGSKPDVTLLGGRYKKVTSSDVYKDETEWSAVIEYERLKK